MSDKINDGGPAYPSTNPIFQIQADRDNGSADYILVGGDGKRVGTCSVGMETDLVPHTGMSLRDWFAGQALTGNLQAGVKDDMDNAWWYGASEIAERAYEIADAMLKARNA